jgi:hypothetical protein
MPTYAHIHGIEAAIASIPTVLITDNITFSESVGKNLNRQVQDSISSSDLFLVLHGAIDTISFTDSISKAVTKTVNDTIFQSETVGKGKVRSIADIMTSTDLITNVSHGLVLI